MFKVHKDHLQKTASTFASTDDVCSQAEMWFTNSFSNFCKDLPLTLQEITCQVSKNYLASSCFSVCHLLPMRIRKRPKAFTNGRLQLRTLQAIIIDALPDASQLSTATSQPHKSRRAERAHLVVHQVLEFAVAVDRKSTRSTCPRGPNPLVRKVCGQPPSPSAADLQCM